MTINAGHRQIKLAVRSISKSYGTVQALADVSLEVAEGEFLTLLGPSGSGKTTLLMIVAGLHQQTSGEIWIDGRPASNLPPRAREIGVVFQNYALFPHLTVFENIAFPLQMRRCQRSEIEQRVADVLSVVELSHAAGRLPRELSGGQQQRVALARATVYRPPLVLMDEPLGALDRRLREQMQLEIRRLHKALKTTVLYVTHDQEEAMSMSDRVCLMHAGRIEQLGPPEALYFRPETAFAANFLGESNVLQGSIRSMNSHRMELMLPSGELVSIAHSEKVKPGQINVQFLLRPESIRLLSAGESAPNTIEGEVTEVVFGGNSYKVFVALRSGGTVVLRVAAGRSSPSHEIGTNVALTWLATDAVVLT
jgi:putative spermidine/putrescine transport system ATP-binding protein